eukprot:EG_transcript_13976
MPFHSHRKKGAEAVEFFLLLDHLSGVEGKAGCKYAVEWQTAGKASKGALAPRPVAANGTVDFQEKFTVTSTVRGKDAGHKEAWLELKVLQVTPRGREKTFDKLVLNLVQCSQLGTAAKGRIQGKRCAASVTVACRLAGGPPPVLDAAAANRQAALEQRYEEAQSELQDMHDRGDLLVEELQAKEQEVDMLRQKVEELRALDEELEEATREVALLQEQLEVACNAQPQDAAEQEERIADLQQKVTALHDRKKEELAHLHQLYVAEVQQLESQMEFLLLSEEEQDQQLMDLRAQVERLKGPPEEGRDCACVLL